jgi:hypothetical protein
LLTTHLSIPLQNASNRSLYDFMAVTIELMSGAWMGGWLRKGFTRWMDGWMDRLWVD